ncbi:MAG: tRNA1(Val) (adenine(37)-N6)-methyltransferase [Nitrospirota bacterium]
MIGITQDSIALRGAGVIGIAQPEKGHRFTLDSILLADFCRIRPKDRVLEPGAGTGIISLLLAKKHPAAHFTALEVQPQLALLCEQNAVANSLDNRIIVISRDLIRLGRTLDPGSFSVIVANPPYIKEGTGRTSPHASRQIARQDRAAPLAAWLNLHRYLKNGGKYSLVFPAARLAELIDLLSRRGLEPKRLRLVHPYQDRPASLALIEAVKNAGIGLEVLPPLVIHRSGGSYSDEMTQIYGFTPPF